MDRTASRSSEPSRWTSDERTRIGKREEEERAVHLRFPAKQKHRLQRREPVSCADRKPIWTERPLLLQRSDGTFELIGNSANLSGLARWILSFAIDVKVVHPHSLQRRVHDLASAVAQIYKTEEMDGPA